MTIVDPNDIYLGAGKIIVFSEGDYSDYGYCGMYVTLRPLLRSEMAQVAEETRAECHRIQESNEAMRGAWWAKPEAERGPFPVTGATNQHELFQTNLIKRGLLMVVDYNECHIGSYGELSVPT